MKPIIGVTPSPSTDALPHGTFARQTIGDAYLAAVAAAGGLAVVLPPRPEHLDDLVSAVDGILLSGGADIDPAHYGVAEIHPTTYGIDPRRDEFELRLVHAALARRRPIFGICRGIQVLNVALGGTLIQDIPTSTVVPRELVHRQHEIGLAAHEVAHDVRWSPLGIAAGCFAAGAIGVNSFHHQAIAELAADLTSVGVSADGLIEAVVGRGDCWLLGVQWHPELMFEHHPEQLRPFAALVEAAARGRLVGRG